MFGITAVPAAGTGNVRYRKTYVLRIGLGKKRVYLPQRVKIVGDVQEFCIQSPIPDRLVDHVAGEYFPHIADMDGAGWGDTGRYAVGVVLVHLWRTDICPVNFFC